MSVDTSRAACLVFACGATGTGKSYWTTQQVRAARPERLIVFDPDKEHGDLGHVTSNGRELIRAVQLPRFAVVWQPSFDPDRMRAEFGVCCQFAFDIASRAGRTVSLFVDELHQVTDSNRAPMWWKTCVSRGRKHGVSVYAASQRPADVDKNLFTQATMLRTGYLGYKPDQVQIANAMGIDPAEIAALSGHSWILRDSRTVPATITRG